MLQSTDSKRLSNKKGFTSLGSRNLDFFFVKWGTWGWKEEGLVQGWNVGWRERVIGEMTGIRGLLWGYVKTYFSENTLESTRMTIEKISNRYGA